MTARAEFAGELRGLMTALQADGRDWRAVASVVKRSRDLVVELFLGADPQASDWMANLSALADALEPAIDRRDWSRVDIVADFGLKYVDELQGEHGPEWRALPAGAFAN